MMICMMVLFDMMIEMIWCHNGMIWWYDLVLWWNPMIWYDDNIWPSFIRWDLQKALTSTAPPSSMWANYSLLYIFDKTKLQKYYFWCKANLLSMSATFLLKIFNSSNFLTFNFRKKVSKIYIFLIVWCKASCL